MPIEKSIIKTSCTPIEFIGIKNDGIELYTKRDDLNHTSISGNKWHKLHPNLEQAQKRNCQQILTFGGAFSNHIAATAAAAKQYGFQSIGIIRGQELAKQPEKWSHTLKLAAQNGMRFEFVSRQAYRQRHNEAYLKALQQRYPNAYLIPEGGSNDLALKGFKPLMQQINQQLPDWTHICCAVGTGCTLAGLVSFAQSHLDKQLIQPQQKTVFGIAVLKQAEYLLPQINDWIEKATSKVSQDNTHWQLITDHHHGGYAKQSPELKLWQQQFEQASQIPLDPVYTAKLFYAVEQLIATQQIKAPAKVIILHSGGLQGRTEIDG